MRYAWIPTGPGDAPLRWLALADGRSSVNQRKLRRHGLAGWQPATTAALLTAWELTDKPGAFFDVGANAGVYALLCRLLWPSIQAIAFEPSPTTVAAGRRWAQANEVEVHFEPVAVSDTDGRGTLHLSARSDASHSLVTGFREPSGALEVELVTLDTYVEREGVAPTVVKIDVEQHEPAVVNGAQATLTECRPVVVMEVLQTGASSRADRRLRDLGYQAHRLGARDWLYWPDGLCRSWHERWEGWRRAVERCVPRRLALPSAAGGRPLRSGRGRRSRRAP